MAPPARVSVAAAPYPAPVITGYVPLESNATRATMLSANSAAGATLDFTVGITNAGAGAVMFYDHWEDGYEIDITNPVQSSTLVWGDTDPVGGNAATFCGARCAGDLLPAGAVFVLRNNIPIPRSTSVLFDGRDRISSTRGFAITAGGFSTPLGSVLSASASAFDTSKWGTDYWIPIGENMIPPAGTSDAFSTTSIQVMADQPNTVVDVDTDGDGFVDRTETIGAGQVTFVNGGVNRGARVRTSKPVQVHVGSGDAGASYELRWFTLFPTPLLTSDYVNPVGSSNDGQRTITYVFNQNPTPITITPSCTGCTGTLSVPAFGGASYASPVSQAVRFQSSGGETFSAVGAGGSESGAAPGSNTNGDGSASWDWGFGLVPTRLLTPKAVLGWAPGNSNNPPALPVGNRDDNPVWISTLGNTTLYIDRDGDPSTGALGPDCDGNLYDQSIQVLEGASTKIFDATDGDMTGASIYTCDGTLLAGAWGEDASNAPPGAPGFDAGYALIPSTAMIVDKTSALGLDTNSDGRFGPGDIVQYDISIADAGALAFTDVNIADAIPDGSTYVAGSATYDNGSGTNAPFADDVTPPAATAFPFDEGGAALPTIAPGTTVHIRYRVAIMNPFPAGTSIRNIVDVGSDQETGGDVDIIDLVAADLSLGKIVTSAPTYLGQNATFRLTLSNAGPDTAEDVDVTDQLPAGLTYVSSTRSAGSFNEITGVWAVGDVAANTSATLDIVATVNTLSATNTAEITHSLAADPDSTPANDSTNEDDDASAVVTVQPRADVSLAKQRLSGPDSSGNTTFRLTTANAGPSPSAGVLVTDHPPTGAVFVSAVPVTNATVDGTFDGSTNVWTVPNLTPGSQAQIDVVYDTSAGPGTNYAQVTASTVDDPDSTPDSSPLSDSNPPDQDDEASAVAPARSDVSVTNVVTVAPTHVGDLVTFTVTTRNDGPNDTAGVAITDQLPPGLTFVSSNPSVGTYDPLTGVWTVGDLDNGASETLVIIARVMSPGALSTTAELTAATVPDIDSTPNNDVPAEDDQASAGVNTTGATLGDTVWFDVDNNFSRSAGEPGLGGVTVNAVWTNPDGGANVTYSTTTDTNGVWSLTGLPSGNYTVSVDPSTLPNRITVATRDRDGAMTPHTTTLTLSGGQAISDVDFAYTGSGLIGDSVFADTNANALPDTDEGIAGVSVTLIWFGPDGSPSSDDVTYTTTTDGFGDYRFPNLPAGPFAVSVDPSTLPGGLTNSIDPDLGTANTAAVTIGVGEQRTDLDFGYDGTNAIGDTVFADINSDGTQGPGEIGLGGIEVALSQDVDGDGTFETAIRTTTTSGTGTYRFGLLPAGAYRVALSVPSGLTPTRPANVDVSVGSGEEIDTADFGLRPQPTATGSIGDFVWNDINGNGSADSAEPGVPGATVSLRADTDGDGIFETLVATQASRGNGSYGFAHLRPGSYQVSVIPPAGLFPTTVVSYAVDLAAGQAIATVDFGLSEVQDASASIGDVVWDDTNGNGVLDGSESGVPGATVTLRQDLDGNGVYETTVTSTTTNSNGAYQFPSLPAGAYRAVITVPVGQSPTTPTAFDIDLAAGQMVDNIDFGLTSTPPVPGNIGDRVWLDVDGDGQQDSAEPGTNGVNVALMSDRDGDGTYETTIGSTTTSGNGNYQFTNVAPGSYRVVATPPDGLSVTTSAAVVTLNPGATIDSADVGLATIPSAPYDLAITKQAGAAASNGNTMTWTLAVLNNSATATPVNIQVIDDLPSALTYVSAGGPGWSCGNAGQVVTCDHAARLTGGESASIEIVTRINASAGTTITNGATVSAGGGEITVSNNESLDDVSVVAALATPTNPTTTPTTGPLMPDPGTAAPTATGTPTATTTPATTPSPTVELVRTGGSPTSVLQVASLVLALGALLISAARARRRAASEIDIS